MPRKPHIVGKPGEGKNPDCFVVVQAAVKHVYSSEGDDTGHSEFDGWFAEFCTWTHDGLKVGQVKFGKTVAEFYSYLNVWSGSHRNCWLVSLDAREQMAALKLWDQFLSGGARFNGFDVYRLDKDAATENGTDKGFVVLSAPPTIVCFKLLGRDTAFTWVGTENYGAKSLKVRFPAGTNRLQNVQEVPDGHWTDKQWIHPLAVAVREWLQSYLYALETLLLGPIERTAATQALTGYRRSYMNEPIFIHDNDAATQIERKALYGGRCEVRFLGCVYSGDCPVGSDICAVEESEADGERQPDLYAQPAAAVPKKLPCIGEAGPIYQFDVNSLYPSVAAAALLPCKLETFVYNPSVQTVLAACRAAGVIAKVEIGVTSPVAPSRNDESTAFPVGRFTTTLCGPEIRLADRYGKILKVEYAAVYRTRPIYREWVKRLYGERLRLRNEGEQAMSDCVKAVLNASFGKWAQHTRRWVDVPGQIAPWPFYQWSEQNRQNRQLETWRAFAWNVQRLEECGEPGDSFPAITAYINSLGRVRLWELLEIAGLDNVYYYDTDSIWCNEVGRVKLYMAHQLHETELGKLKLAGTYEVVEFRGIKRYIADGMATIAGAASRPANGGDAFHVQLKAPPLAYYLSKCDVPGLDRRISRVRMNVPYDLGRVRPDGWVEPFRAG